MRALARSLPIPRGLGVFDRDDMQWINRNRKLICVNHNNRLGRNSDEIAMRYYEAPSVRQPERERGESVVQPLFDLLNHRHQYSDA